MAKSDGRYRRSIITSNLEKPTSIAVDPEHGLMFWTDAGNNPKIETAWMDGTRRRVIVSTNIGSPEAITVDYAMGHTIYWVDSKLNTIEMMDHDGENRHVVARGKSLKKPVSVDIFESNMFWINRKDGSVIQQDKFGRGVPVTLASSLANPRSLKVLHPYRYNSSLHDPCNDPMRCSHLCVIVPGHRARCQCPDGQNFVDRQSSICDAASEAPVPQPRICKCQNGGICDSSGKTTAPCVCEPDFHGTYCENSLKRIDTSESSVAPILVPIFLVIVVALLSVGLYIYFKKRDKPVKSFRDFSNSVSFRAGNNVEFAGPNFANTGVPEAQGETNPPNDFGLQDVTTEGKRDFSNPMYEAYGQLESQATADAVNYSIPSGDSSAGSSSAGGSRGSPASTLAAGASGFMDAPSAVLPPSSVIHKSSPQLNVRHKELAPSSVDTGKDTQCLVEEDDSEC